MATRAVLLLVCAAALVAAGAAFRQPAPEAQEALAALGNVSDAQVAALRRAVLSAAQKAAQLLVERLKEAAAGSEDENKQAEAEFIAWAEKQRAAEAAPDAEAAKGEQGAVVAKEDDDDDDDDDEEEESDESIADTVRRILREGLPGRGIPPLDPFLYSPVIPLKLELEDILRLHAELQNVSFKGLASFQEDVDFDFSISYLPPGGSGYAIFDVLFPTLELSTLYEVDGSAEVGLDIWGDGPIEILLNRLRVKGHIAIRAILTVTVDPCELDISSRSIKLGIEGLFGEGILSGVASEVVTDMVNELLWSQLFEVITSTIQEGICGYLKSLSIIDLGRIYLRIRELLPK